MIGREPIFVDTWGWLALGNLKDSFHHEVEKVMKQIQASKVPIYSSEYVLDELISLLFRRVRYANAVEFMETIFESVKSRELVIERVSIDRFDKAWNLRKRLKDKPNISFTDLTSMIIMRDLSIRYVLTEDNHFLHVGFDFINIP